MIKRTRLNEEDAQAWHEKMGEIFDVLSDTDTVEALNMLMHAVAGMGIMSGVTKESLMEGLDVTYDAVYENSVPTDIKEMH